VVNLVSNLNSGLLTLTSNSVVENNEINAVLKIQKDIVLPKANLKHRQGFSKTAKTILLK
jgi:hypothetical protein